MNSVKMYNKLKGEPGLPGQHGIKGEAGRHGLRGDSGPAGTCDVGELYNIELGSYNFTNTIVYSKLDRSK